MKSDYSLFVIRHQELSPTQKLFLLWCWCNRDNDERYDLFGKDPHSYLYYRSIRWYANVLGFFCRMTAGYGGFYDRFMQLIDSGFIKVENKDTDKEVTYVDFCVCRERKSDN